MGKKLNGKICNLGYACDGCPYHRERNGQILCYKKFYENRVIKKCSHEGCNEDGIIKGLCRNHYQQKRYSENERVREKFRQYSRKYSKKFRAKKKIEDPKYFTRMNREWRSGNPEKYAYNTAKYYLKKLSPQLLKKLLTEIQENVKK